jgi:hypothetical protein
MTDIESMARGLQLIRRKGELRAEIARVETELAERSAEMYFSLKRERDEARQDAERWEDDALRLLNERNAALKERDEARRMYCILSMRATGEDPMTPHIEALARTHADRRGWDCFGEDIT